MTKAYRPQPRVPPVQVQVFLNPQIAVWIERLLDSGAWGKTRADVIERLVEQRLVQLAKEYRK